jgi:hypothetical protein
MFCTPTVGARNLRFSAVGADRFLPAQSANCANRSGCGLTLLHEEVEAHANRIRCVDVFGARIATASRDSTAVVWCANKYYPRLSVLKKRALALREPQRTRG